MADSSSSIGFATTSDPHYDVFLNFRGPDVKESFAAHLYHRLISHGLQVFLDQDELQVGLDISSQIETAIRVASVHIAIFSPNYAESRWCLDELVCMLESGATILPVFYNVKPSELRWTRTRINIDGAYAEALHRHEQKGRYDIRTIQKWREALYAVSDISGFVLEAFSGDEAELLDQVVQKVLRLVPQPLLSVAKYPTGLEEKIADFERTVLSQQQEEYGEAKVVGIVGSGGVGKTTLAKAIFNRKRSDYERSSFLFDMRETAAKMGLNHIQSKLIKDLRLEIENAEIGVEKLKIKHSNCDALIVLDDVDHVNQLDAFLPIKHVLHTRSLILVTSRDMDVLKSAGIEESSIYHVNGLNLPESRQLFNLYAFNQPHPPPEFEDLVEKFLRACNGLPLSLKVLGSLLCGRSDRHYWEDLSDRLNRTLPATSIQERLRISYDALHQEEKQIFLDIAYFFIGKNRDTAIRIWDGSGWDGLVRFQNLQNRCLVEVDTENKIAMHPHLQDLGRSIVHDSQIMHRRLSYPVDDFDDLRDSLEQSSSGSAPIMPTFECVNSILEFLFKSILHKRWHNCSSLLKYIQAIPTEVRGIRMSPRSAVGDTCAEGLLPLNESSSEEVFGISKLQLLEAQGDFVERILTWVHSPNLLWLRWNECPCSSLPSWIPTKDLRVLEVAGGKLERLWHRKSEAPLQLRELNIDAPLLEFPESIVQLKHLEKIVLNYTDIEGTHLTTLPENFGFLWSLKYIELKRCYKLTTLPDSFGNLTNLRHIDLSECKSLEMLPDSFGCLINLQHINLSMCESLQSLPDSFGCLINLQHINLSMCESLQSLPDSFGCLINLQHINLSMCESLQSLPDSFGCLRNLQHINLSMCRMLEMLPDSFGNLTGLLQIDLSYSTSLKRLPISLGNLTDLQYINISMCRSLKMLPVSLGNLINLQNINLSFCESLERLPISFGNLTSLHDLNLSSCKCLQMLPDSLGNLTNLQELNLSSCQSLQMLPESLGNLTNLHDFNLSSCKSLQMLPESLGNLTNLHFMNLSSCESLQMLPDSLGNLTNLHDFNLSSCKSLQMLPDSLGNLTNLHFMNLSSCESLQMLPDSLGNLTNLHDFNLSSCKSLQMLPDSVGNLTNLHFMNLSSCESLQMLPDSLGNLTNLQSINLSSCKSLYMLPDSLRNMANLQIINLS